MPNNRATRFFQSDKYAVLGMSRTRKNFAWHIYRRLLKSGATVFAVHPEGGVSRDVPFYRSLDSLPEKVESALICFDVTKSGIMVNELKNSGIRTVWFQQGSYNDSIIEDVRCQGIEAYTGCAMMYMPQASFPHRLHRFFHELTAKGTN